MRPRLWHRLFLASAALSIGALAGFALWQQQVFRRGFLDYLDQVALERLQPASTRLAAAYAENGNWDFLRDDPRAFGDLIEPRDARHRERPPPPRDGEPPRADDRDAALPPLPPIAPGMADRSASAAPPRQHIAERRLPPPPPHGPPDLMPRLGLFDAGGAPIAGNPDVPADAPTVAVLREADGARIATLRLARLPRISADIDLGFAQAQARNALVAALAVLLASLLIAVALARWLLTPVRALTTGTRALAAGDYARRIDSKRRDELGALAADFDHLAENLEQNRTARQRWGADIAHELRTPLSVLRGEIQALQDGIRTPGAEAFESLDAECERLGRLIDDLYQLALADAGALDYRFESVALADIADEAIALQRHTCADAGLVIDQAFDRIPAIHGDRRRLAQLIDNLLANARRYTDAPGRIRVAVERIATRVRLIVEDSAPGVAADDLPRLFDRLYRVDASRNRASGGAGLGLAICRAIVAAHDGEITASMSTLGGLRVVVDLPPVDETRR